MCTLIAIKNVFPGYPLVVAANRDELFSRRSASPTFSDVPFRTLAPTDLERGGTWIGVNDRPLLVALTNRKAIPSVRGMRSRGELVTDALKMPSLSAALASVIDRDPGEHNGCYMLLTDGHDGWIVTGNGVGGTDGAGRIVRPGFTCEPLSDGLTIVTNLGLGSGSPRSGAIMDEWDKMNRERMPAPGFSAFVPMLSRHDGDWLEEGFRGRRQAGICLHPTKEDGDYGTVSSSVIRLSDTDGGSPLSWHYWHGTRKKSSAFCEVRWSDMLTLPVTAR